MTETGSDPSSAQAGQPLLLRHIAPVVAGGAIAGLLMFVTDNWLGAHGMLPTADATPPRSTLLFLLASRGLFAVLGCHMAARLAPEGQPRIRYALALGALLLVLSIVSAMSSGGRLPMWYSLASIALQGPWAIIGGGTATRVMSRAAR